jgi:hypothetical protein
MANDETTKPVVGMGMTYNIGGDSYPYTITRVTKSGKTFWAKADSFLATPGANSFEVAEKVGTFKPNPDAPERKFTCKKCGGYGPVGDRARCSMGVRRFRQDPHF